MQQLIKRSKDEWGIIGLQNCILNIAKYIHDVCKANDIEYYLMGGSALGAVRHKGFIPWDDDLDIFMRPKDYTKFRTYFKEFGDKENFYLQEWGASNGMITLAKLRYNHSRFIEDDLRNWNIHQGVFIDIFILHDSPDNKISRLNQFVWAKYLVMKGASNRHYSRKGVVVKTLLSMLRLFPRRFLLNFALKQVYKYNGKTSNYYCHFLGRAGLKRGLYSKEYFSHGKEMKFETISLMVPAHVEKYLKDRWGDYMQLPSEDEIRHYQHCSEWSDTIAFNGVGSSTNDYKDERFLIS